VQAFLDREVSFLDIPRVIEAVITTMSAGTIGSLDDVLAADAEARSRARERLRTPKLSAARAAL
jgi:1-deoxy-D-xylulose-5-phosphate reductoisomerase